MCVCDIHYWSVLSYSRCQKHWHANKPQNPTLILQFSVCVWGSLYRKEWRIRASIDMDTLTHIHSPYLVAHGKAECMSHEKHFIFILRLGPDDRFRTCHISWLSRPSSLPVAIVSLLVMLYCGPRVKWHPQLFLPCRAWKDLRQSLLFAVAYNCLVPSGTPCTWKMPLLNASLFRGP